MDRVTFATSSGIVWLALAVHFAAGFVSIVAGTVALSFSKGGRLHRQSGSVFTSAMTTVKSLPGIGPRFNVALMILAFTFAVAMLFEGVTEWLDPTLKVVGRPRVVPPMVAGTVMLLAAIGDLRAIRAGGLQGSRRLARHLWRMCCGLFVAIGSFFLGQMKFIPEPVRNVPLLLVLAFAPILLLIFWMWRVRVRGRIPG